jgi:hypothetical protein
MNLWRRALREDLADRLLDPQVVKIYEQKGAPPMPSMILRCTRAN